MNKQEFEIIDLFADCVNDRIDELHNEGQFNNVLRELQEAVNQLPDRYSINWEFKVNIFDNQREQQIPLLQTGFNAHHSEEPYRHYADSTIQKYYVEGEMSIVPHDYCPHCWEEWGFKFKHTICPYCEYELGKQVKYFLDDDVCPMCEEGTVTSSNPVCDKCEEEVDPQKVVWG